MISAVSVSPRRQRLGLYFRFYKDNFNQVRVCESSRQLLGHLRGAVVLLLDNSTIHHGEPIKKLRQECPRLRVAFFPAAALEFDLNSYEA